MDGTLRRRIPSMADVFDRHRNGVVRAYFQAALNTNLQWAAAHMFDELTNENWEAGAPTAVGWHGANHRKPLKKSFGAKLIRS